MSLIGRLAGLFRGQRTEAAAAPEPPSESPAVRPTAGPVEPPQPDAKLIVDRICAEALGGHRDISASLSGSPRWQALKDRPPELQCAVLMVILERYGRSSGRDWRTQELHRSMLAALLRRNLPLTEGHLADLLAAWHGQRYGLEYGLPGQTILGAVERYQERAQLTGRLRTLLGKIQDRAAKGSYPGQPPNKVLRAIADRAGRLLDPSSATVTLPTGPFAKQFSARLAGLSAERRTHWLALAGLAAEAGAKSKPSRKWLAAVEAAMAPLDRGEIMRSILQALEETTPDPSRPDDSLDILKGLVWASVRLDHAEVVGPLGRFADKCFRKLPGIGARSVSLGNAALWALSEMADEPRAAAELFRLRERIKYASTRKGIDARLGDLAGKSGQTVEDLEDLSLPDFGLAADGVAVFRVGDARAELTVRADAAVLQWFSRDGKPLKSAPAEARKDHAAALADVRRRAKEIEEARASQALRLEQSWLEERSWTFADWTERYLRHPLRRPIVEALIWRVGSRDFMAADDALVDVEGQVHEAACDARVQLWHPLDATPEQVLAWRRRILERGVTQPIKQAHREIYVLTEAERRTRVYSNRFAAHILRQHQFRALCQARGWTYGLMGGWDGWNVPTRRLPKQGMTVEYQVEVVDDGRQSESGVALYLTTDQVRFNDVRGEAVELDAIPPVVFSEVLRDVDLFVAVTSVANDPGWTDGGPEGRHGGYWREWAFGELGQSAQTRRELVSWIVPKLSIADKLEVTDKFLVVTGKRQSYAIHLGSGNIQIRPGNRYLCIVPSRDPGEAAAIKLPFTGDGVLSTILAKAFLLVDESKIKDPTILSQL